ncbi:MAG: RrF2 family transcriptional regulator [Clostridia bacterium]|nr:RrF2 family transcriptional regulator [Clostridia bacterium]
MLISTRGRYALRVLIDLAEHSDGGFTAMKEIAARQRISLKYLEKILPLLVSERLIEGVHGKGGGYRLTKEPEDYKVRDILLITEGTLAPVACLECGAAPCDHIADCRTIPMWRELDRRINDYLGSVTIADLMKKSD